MKRGISLITLIITIIVVIILAAAVVLNLSDTNIIEQANNAVETNNARTNQEAFELYKVDLFVQNDGEFDESNLSIVGEDLVYDTNGDGDVTPNISKPLDEVFPKSEIVESIDENGELVQSSGGGDSTPEEELPESFVLETINSIDGINYDRFKSVIESNGNYIAVGYTSSDLTSEGGNTNYGNNDFVIAKFDSNLDLVAINNFGGTETDRFNSVIESNGKYIAVGYTSSDLTLIGGNANINSSDFVIAEFDSNLNLTAINNKGTNDGEWFNSVIESNGNYIAVGRFNGFDLTSLGGNNESDNGDFVMAKFNSSLDLIAINNQGGLWADELYSVIESGGSYVAVGYSGSDLTSIGGNEREGSDDAVIVKFDTNLNITAINNMGGTGAEEFNSIIESNGSYIAVGFSSSDLTLIGGNESVGSYGFVAAKFDTNLNLTTINNFGGGEFEYLTSVVEVADGYVAVGNSRSDLTSIGGNATTGYDEFLITKLNPDLSLNKITNFGGRGGDFLESVIESNGSYVAVGYTESKIENGEIGIWYANDRGFAISKIGE